jgi:hypothetical protein
MNKISDSGARRTYNPFAAWFFNPGRDDILRKQLREAEAQRAEYAAEREYAEAMETMLDKRIARLKKELE